MAHLDATGDLQGASIRGAVARDDAAQVGHRVRLGHVAAPVDPGQVVSGLVRANHEIRHGGHFAVGDHPDLPARIDRPDEARLAAEVFDDFRLGGHAVIGHARRLGQFDRIGLVVAADQYQHETGVGHGGHRFHRALQADIQQLGNGGAGFLGRGVHPAHGFGRGGAGRGLRSGGGFHVGGVIGTVGEGDGVFSGIGHHVELLRCIAANGARVGLHRAEIQAQPGEDTGIGGVHIVVFVRQPAGIDMERIGVLHQEFARAHHPEPRPDLVAELGLDLVEVDRQLLVAGQLVAGEIGNHFLVGRAHAIPGLLAVLQFEQLAAEDLPAAAFLPQFARLHRRHQQFHRAGGIHFLADHGFHLAQHAQAQWRPGVEARGQAPDQAGTQHQPMAGDLGVGGDFTGGVQVESRQAHGSASAGRAGHCAMCREAGRRVARPAGIGRNCPACPQSAALQ